MRKIIWQFCLLVLLLCNLLPAQANDGGMWLLSLLKKYNAEELKKMGLNIPLEAITGEKEGALSEAVVNFGSGCTGAIISSEGLVITNYHCSYSAIQQLSTPAMDIWNNGYWAKNNKEELPVGGLTVTINKRILNISEEVEKEMKAVAGIRPTAISALAKVEARYRKAYPQYKILTRTYRNSTVFVLFLQLQYSDVRLVGAVPRSVAKFGGETDNWMWPRHSGDFAFFRVYANKKGMPAAYSAANAPLAAATWLRISKKGYSKGDFAMSMGYPVQSDRYATSSQVWEKQHVLNPPMIAARRIALGILENEMAASDTTRLIYAEKFASTANYYKNAIGMVEWIEKLHTIQKKQAFEKGWSEWMKGREASMQQNADLPARIEAAIKSNAEGHKALTYYGECTNISDLLRFISAFGNGFPTIEKGRDKPETKQNYLRNFSSYYRKFDVKVEKQLLKGMLKLMIDSVPVSMLPGMFAEELQSHAAIDKYIDQLFDVSIFADSTRLISWVKHPVGKVENDPGFKLGKAILTKQQELFKPVTGNASRINKLQSLYKSTIADYSSSAWYPDADRTIRLSYGKVDNLQIDNKVLPYYTTLSELVAKADPVKKDFWLHPKLEAIWKEKDFAQYAVNGDMPVCFIAEGDVTGGNSGSPMLNGNGELIGLVFDCNWESMTREFNYEPKLNRVICADIRYLLLLTEKFSGSDRLIKELE